MKKQADTPYAGRLASFGDPTLDEMTSAVRERKVKEKPAVLETCPGCSRARILIRGHYARLCAECHDDITRLAALGRIWE